MQDVAEEHRKGTGEDRGEQGNTGYGRLVRSTGEGQESTGEESRTKRGQRQWHLHGRTEEDR